MACKYYIEGYLINGNTAVEFKNKNVINDILAAWKDKDLLVELSIIKNKRTNNQNRYLHGVIVPMIINFHKETQGENLTISEAKAWIYNNVLGQKIESKNILGDDVFFMKGKSFSQMTTIEFNEAKEIVQAYFSKLGLDIPDPNEKNTLNSFI